MPWGKRTNFPLLHQELRYSWERQHPPLQSGCISKGEMRGFGCLECCNTCRIADKLECILGSVQQSVPYNEISDLPARSSWKWVAVPSLSSMRCKNVHQENEHMANWVHDHKARIVILHMSYHCLNATENVQPLVRWQR